MTSAADTGPVAGVRAGGATFGIFDWIDAAPGADVAALFDDRLRMIQAADRAGVISTYHLAEHHGTPLGHAPSPSLFLAAAARVTETIRLAPTVFVLPLYEPLRLAQEIAMLDQLSHGRLDVGLGRGSVPIEGEFYGLSFDAMAERYQELEPVLLDALASGVFRGPPREGAPGEVPLHVTTWQKPHLPLWYPTVNPQTVPRLAEHGFDTLFGFAWFSPPASEIAAASDAYFALRRAAEQRGGPRYAIPGRAPRFGTMRHVLIADSEDEAVAIGRRAVSDFNANFTFLPRRHHPGLAPNELDFDELRSDSKVLIGSPESVTVQLAELMTVGRLNYFAGVFAWGSLTSAQTLRSLDLFQTRVIPAVRAASQDRQPAANDG